MISATQLNRAIDMLKEHDELTARFHALDTSLFTTALLGLGAIYKPKHFASHEFLPPEIYQVYGDRGLMFMDSRILWTADALRDYFKAPVYINNWFWKGQTRYRGLRPFDCAVGARLSQHKFGRAIDFFVKGIESDEVRKEIKAHPGEASFTYITAAEEDIPHVHLDCRNTNKEGITWFKP
jgi:hypothetical protein